jgi:hypothetical protein
MRISWENFVRTFTFCVFNKCQLRLVVVVGPTCYLFIVLKWIGG